MRVLGLMSGTSADGVDAVLAEFHGPSPRPRWRLLASAALPYPAELQQRLVALGQGQPQAAAELLDLAEALTEHQAAAARHCDPDGRAELIGCHGQTVWHRPPRPPRRGASWQLLQGPLLAQLLQRPVVHDFRANDLALGGQGAPLVPATDAALLGGIGGWRALLNLGGIANLTLLPPRSGPERQRPVLGWDCGPANTLLDLAVRRFSQGRLGFDAEGAWARQGRCDEELLGRWLREDYFQQAPPKSTGRELFGQTDLERRLAELGMAEAPWAHGESPGPAQLEPPAAPPAAERQRQANALATLTALTAAAVARDLNRGTKPLELLVAGGGARNRLLMEELRRRCRGVRVRPLAELGIGDSEREPLAFALLAWWRWRRHPGSLPSVTGARRAALLGVVADPA
ncbi:MAG: anhydro-N-acetylmuramic acid kinase [Synechococcaceae cyanobacterium]|nr:anhydro-N-acetylmuramic acid kinase [Synechococcaceae cyanobacterium]